MHSTRLLKFNDTNIALQKALAAQSNAAQAAAANTVAAGKAGVGSKGATKDGGRSLGRKEGRGTKRGREEVSGRPFDFAFIHSVDSVLLTEYLCVIG